MVNRRLLSITLATLLVGASLSAQKVQTPKEHKKSVVDEVVWLVGDEPILRSDIEFQKLRLLSEGHKVDGNPDCFIPEQIAVQKLFLNQAKIDSITVSDQQVNRFVEAWIENASAQLGGKEKLEEYFNKKINQIREDERRERRNQEIVRSMQQRIVQKVQVGPSEIRAFFNALPQDSLPFIPRTMEVQKISVKPKVDLAEIDRVKARLREFVDDVNSGKRDFSTLARLYSEDKKTSLHGGEYGFVGRATLEKDFANVVFNLSDPKRASQIVKTEEGYHIVQLIEKRGDMINFRHILLRPQTGNKAVTDAVSRLDSIKNYIAEGKFTFEQAAEYYSEDKDTRANGGIMINSNAESELSGSASFVFEDLPQDVSKEVHALKTGEISKPFILRLPNGTEEVVIVKLKEVHEGHRANLNSDYRTIKSLALANKREREIENWIRRKQKETPIRISDSYENCDFRYPGWVKE